MCTTLRALGSNGRALHFSLESALYIKNPLGPAVGYNAYWGRDRQLAGHYASIPMEALIDGIKARGLLSLNTAIHPQHQGKRLFTRLAESTYARSANEGFKFVIGVANQNSTHGFVKRLGFQNICPLQARVGLGKIEQGTSHSKQTTFQPLWEAPTLTWRTQAPGRNYKLIGPLFAGKGLSLAGQSQIPGLPVIMSKYLPESIRVPELYSEKTGIGPRPWLYIGHDPSINWNRTLSITIPQRLRPSPLREEPKRITQMGPTAL